MTLLDEYLKANSRSDFHESWKRFKGLLDEETYFFAPRSYRVRAQRTLLLVPERNRLEKARKQVVAYNSYFPLRKFVYWLFDIGDISAKKVWVAYSDLWKGTERPAIEQFNTFKPGFNALAPLLPRSWKKVIKSIGHFLSFLSRPENWGKNDWRPTARTEPGIELVEYNRHVHAKPKEGSPQANPWQLMLSSNLSRVTLSKDDDVRWAYVFICSYFEIDWRSPDKQVVQQNAKRSFRKNFVLQLHPDKKPEFFINKDWGNKLFWGEKIADARKGQFNSTAEMRDMLLKILEDHEMVDLEWRGDRQLLQQAVEQGNDLRRSALAIVNWTERAAKGSMQKEEYEREEEEYRREKEEYRREADKLQKQLDERASQRKMRAEKRVLEKEQPEQQLADSAKALVDRTRISGFLDQPIGQIPSSEDEKVAFLSLQPRELVSAKA